VARTGVKTAGQGADRQNIKTNKSYDTARVGAVALSNAPATPPPRPHRPPPPPPLSFVTPPATNMAGYTTDTAAAATAIVRDGTNASPLLGRLLQELSAVFQREVLEKWLDPTECALFARACWKCGEAVASAGLMRAGDTEAVPLKLVACFASVELLAWAKANRCPWVARTCALAAEYGQVEALQWARVHDCPWDNSTCAAAAWGGKLSALVWAREHGCPWYEATCLAARGMKRR